MSSQAPGGTPGQKIDGAFDGHDDPNRGPLDRLANAVTGSSGGVSGAMHDAKSAARNATDGHDDPNRGPLDRTANAMGIHDDPNRGPLDRASNAAMGHDDPARGPIDRTANALDGHDDPNRGPLDRLANAVTGSSRGTSAALAGAGAAGHAATSNAPRTVSALFDSHAEAQSAIAELRSIGFDDNALSVITQDGRTTTTSSVDGEVVDEHHGSLLRGILGGGALGAGLGVAALAIPGVGPLVAAGAIAAGAVPGAMAVGAAIGAAAGSLNEALKGHGIDDDDINYYNERLGSGGVLVTVDARQAGDASAAQSILSRHGGHSARYARA